MSVSFWCNAGTSNRSVVAIVSFSLYCSMMQKQMVPPKRCPTSLQQLSPLNKQLHGVHLHQHINAPLITLQVQ